MPIFKKAFVAPIVRTSISQGIGDFDNEDDMNFSYNLSDEEKVARLFNDVYKNGSERKALLIASLYFQGYSYQEIRTMIMGRL